MTHRTINEQLFHYLDAQGFYFLKPPGTDESAEDFCIIVAIQDGDTYKPVGEVRIVDRKLAILSDPDSALFQAVTDFGHVRMGEATPFQSERLNGLQWTPKGGQ